MTVQIVNNGTQSNINIPENGNVIFPNHGIFTVSVNIDSDELFDGVSNTRDIEVINNIPSLYLNEYQTGHTDLINQMRSRPDIFVSKLSIEHLSTYLTNIYFVKNCAIFNAPIFGSVYATLGSKNDFIEVPYSDTHLIVVRKNNDQDPDVINYTVETYPILNRSHAISTVTVNTITSYEIGGKYNITFNALAVFIEHIPKYSACCKPAVPLPPKLTSEKMEFSQYIRRQKYKKVMQGRARNVKITNNTKGVDLKLEFKTVGEPFEFYFTYQGDNGIQTRYIVNANAVDINNSTGVYSYTLSGLESGKSYFINILVKYITTNTYPLENLIFVTKK